MISTSGTTTSVVSGTSTPKAASRNGVAASHA